MSSFMIRQSALVEGNYYIDFLGEYEVGKISAKTKITSNVIDHVYKESGGVYDSEHHVYYFPKYGLAADAVNELSKHLKRGHVSRSLELTEEEIEYIRKALINEDSNVIFTNNRIRTSIFNKLNG